VVCPMQSVIGQASVVGVVAPIHQKAMPARRAYHPGCTKIFAKFVLGLSEYV